MPKLHLTAIVTRLNKDLATLRRKQQSQPSYLNLNTVTRAVRDYTLSLHRYERELGYREAARRELEDYARQVLTACVSRRLCTLRQPLLWLLRGRRRQVDFYAKLMREVAQLPSSVRRLIEQITEKPSAHYRRQYVAWQRARRFLASYPSAQATADQSELRRLAGLVRRVVR